MISTKHVLHIPNLSQSRVAHVFWCHVLRMTIPVSCHVFLPLLLFHQSQAWFCCALVCEFCCSSLGSHRVCARDSWFPVPNLYRKLVTRVWAWWES